MDIETKSESDLNPYSAHYNLPSSIKCWVDGLNSAASSAAIITSVFAAVMVSFLQLLPPVGESNSTEWEALRFFNFGAVITNLIAAMYSMWAMWIYSEIPGRAQRLLLDPDSWPSRVARGEPLSKELLADEYVLLDKFGAYSFHVGVVGGIAIWSLLGILTTLISFTLYIWLTQSRAVAGALMIFVVPGFFGFAYPLVAGIPGAFREGWREGWREGTRQNEVESQT